MRKKHSDSLEYIDTWHDPAPYISVSNGGEEGFRKFYAINFLEFKVGSIPNGVTMQI